MLRRLSTLALVLTVSGCAARVVSGHGTASISASTGGPDAVVMAIQAAWVTITDKSTGIRFELPKTPHVQDRNLNGVTAREYSAEYGNGLDVGIAVMDPGSANGARTLFDVYPDAISNQFHSLPQVPSDFAITERKASVVGGHRVSDMRISFTPLSVPKAETVWFIRLVLLGKHLLLLQTIVEAPKSELARYVSETRALHARLVSRLHLR